MELGLRNDYDAIVLDIMLPELSGWEVLVSLRQRHVKTPVIMLSALAEINDKVRALDAGADDYITKPFKVAELIARLHAVARRPPLQPMDVLEYGDLHFSLQTQTLNGVELTAKESQILALLLRHPQRVFSKERILTYVWGNDISPDDSYVEVYISRLRNKLKTLKSQTKIATQRGIGYKLVMGGK